MADNLLQRCWVLHQNGQYQEIIDLLAAIPPSARTPEQDSELARAYNNVGSKSHDSKYFSQALQLLLPHRQHFKDDYFFNFRLGFAYFHLNQFGPALDAFKTALKTRPEDKSTKDFIHDCQQYLALPHFTACFKERVQTAWQTFLQEEHALREMLDKERAAVQAGAHADRHKITMQILQQFDPVFRQACSLLNYDFSKKADGTYSLVLSTGCLINRLAPAAYMLQHAPAEELKKRGWKITLGCAPEADFGLQTDSQGRIGAEDVLCFLKSLPDEKVLQVDVHCPRLTSVLQDDALSLRLLTALTDEVLGEITASRIIGEMHLLKEMPSAEERSKYELVSVLKDLRSSLEKHGYDTSCDGLKLLSDIKARYSSTPSIRTDDPWRCDIFKGFSTLPALLNSYFSGNNRVINEYTDNGAVPGFIVYDLPKELQGQDIPRELQESFCTNMTEKIQAYLHAAGFEDCYQYTGMGSGIYCGYFDFIGWDILRMLEKMQQFWQEQHQFKSLFHLFRLDVPGVTLYDPAAPEEQTAAATDEAPVMTVAADDTQAAQEAASGAANAAAAQNAADSETIIIPAQLAPEEEQPEENRPQKKRAAAGAGRKSGSAKSSRRHAPVAPDEDEDDDVPVMTIQV